MYKHSEKNENLEQYCFKAHLGIKTIRNKKAYYVLKICGKSRKINLPAVEHRLRFSILFYFEYFLIFKEGREHKILITYLSKIDSSF